MTVQERESVMRAVQNGLEKDERVSSVFVTGSEKKGNVTKFSDIDLWLVFLEESGINTFRAEVATIFSAFGILIGVYDCTAHHFFIVYKNGVQIDLNLVTAAQYFSIKSADEVQEILFDRHLYFSDRSQFLSEQKVQKIKQFLLIGYTTLERAISKFSKEDYFVVVRFLDSIRHSAIMPLLPFVEDQEIPNAVSLEVEKLSEETRDLFIETYAKPTKQSNLVSLVATLRLLQIIASRTEIHEFDERLQSIHEFLDSV